MPFGESMDEQEREAKVRTAATTAFTKYKEKGGLAVTLFLVILTTSAIMITLWHSPLLMAAGAGTLMALLCLLLIERFGMRVFTQIAWWALKPDHSER